MFWNDPFMPLITQFGRTAPFMPAADVTVGDGDFVLTLDLPGLTADDVSIELLGEELIVRGERKRPELSENSRWALNERLCGAFERRVRLPEGVDPDSITASMTDGVLSLIVPKPERMKPHRLQITSSSRTEQRELTTA